MQKIRLKRTNHEDLVFTGKLLSSVDDQDRNASNFSWLKITLYQTSTSAYILGITLHRYNSAGLNNFSSAVAFDSIQDLRGFAKHKKCRNISDLLDILLKQATKTNNLLKSDAFPAVRARSDMQRNHGGSPGVAVAP